MDAKQVNNVYLKSDELGADYYNGYPTALAVENSGFQDAAVLASDKKIPYWLRSPSALGINTSCIVRAVGTDNTVSVDYAYSSKVGVRPAYYLNQSTVIINEGIGTKASPFVSERTATTPVSDFDFDVATGTIKKYKGTAENVIIPDKISNVTVTTIGDSAFNANRTIKTIRFPSGLTTLGFQAFYNCSNLTDFTLPDSLTTINGLAFGRCESITSVRIPSKVKELYLTFQLCTNLTNVELPYGLENIGNETFYGCEKIKSIQIPDSVKYIGSFAFASCEALESITIPSSVEMIDRDV